MNYLHEHKNWTDFHWDDSAIMPLVVEAAHLQGLLFGRLEAVNFDVEATFEADSLECEVIASSLVEGVKLDAGKVRSSISRQLGLPSFEKVGKVSVPSSPTREVDGAVAILLDASRASNEPLSERRLLGWHSALFPTGYSGLRKIEVAAYRQGPMKVVSGAFGHERVHFEAPRPDAVPKLMKDYLAWLNGPSDAALSAGSGTLDAPSASSVSSVSTNANLLIKAAIAHLWFLTIHPFEDGNGRIARNITEMQLAKWDASSRRFYSVSHYIQQNREAYYAAIERAQKGSGDITQWLAWFLRAVILSIEESLNRVRGVIDREAFWASLEGVPLNVRQRNMLHRLKGDFEGKLTAAKWAKLEKVSADTALRDINDLVSKGILVRSSAGGRSTSYVVVSLK